MHTSIEARIQACLRNTAARNRDTERIDPFLATFSRTNDNPFLNYAIPNAHAQPSTDDVRALIRAYEHRGLHPRLEYITSHAPDVEAALLDAGFVVEGRLPLMTCRLGDEAHIPVPPDIEFLRPCTDDEQLAVRAVQHEAYGDPEPPTQRDIESLAIGLRAGSMAVLARIQATEEAVGAGEYTGPIGGLTEITSIAVREPFRRRGIAAAMASWLLREAFNAGVTLPFLMAHEGNEGVYARSGFRTISEVLHISR